MTGTSGVGGAGLRQTHNPLGHSGLRAAAPRVAAPTRPAYVSGLRAGRWPGVMTAQSGEVTIVVTSAEVAASPEHAFAVFTSASTAGGPGRTTCRPVSSSRSALTRTSADGCGRGLTRERSAPGDGYSPGTRRGSSPSPGRSDPTGCAGT